jgi:hypothetical protein
MGLSNTHSSDEGASEEREGNRFESISIESGLVDISIHITVKHIWDSLVAMNAMQA